MENFVEVQYLDPQQLSRRIVSCSMFIFPQRTGKTDFNDPKYRARLQVYVDGLKGLVRLTREQLPGFCVRLYLDESVPRDTPEIFQDVARLRDEFPTTLERVLVRATGILADLRDAASPGQTTFLPSLWRFLALFDAVRPADVVHMSDLDTPPFIPFAPEGVLWEKQKKVPLIFATMRGHVPVFCVMGATLARHGLEACAGSGIMSAQRVKTGSSQKAAGATPGEGLSGSAALFPFAAWNSMMQLIVDAHFRAFLERVSDSDAKALTALSNSPQYQRLVREVMAGQRSCEDESLWEGVPDAEALIDCRPGGAMDAAVRKSVQYLKLLMLPVCDGRNHVPLDFRTTSTSQFLSSLHDGSIVLKFQYGIDEFAVHGLFAWAGAAAVQAMEEGENGGNALARMDMDSVKKARTIARGVMSLRRSLGVTTLNYTEMEALFSELWLRLLAFGQKDERAARAMLHGQYTLFAPALGALGVERHTFVFAMSDELARADGFAKVAWKRMFRGAAPSDVGILGAWNTLFIRFMTRWMAAWVERPDLSPWETTGARAIVA